MDTWLKKIEQGHAHTQLKISDAAFSKISNEWNATYKKSQKRTKKTYNKIFYRNDANMLCPLPGGRVGGLSSPVKKWKINMTQKGRTKYTTPPIYERDDWDSRFSVRRQRSTELFCNKVYPPKRKEEEEEEIALGQIAEMYTTKVASMGIGTGTGYGYESGFPNTIGQTIKNSSYAFNDQDRPSTTNGTGSGGMDTRTALSSSLQIEIGQSDISVILERNRNMDRNNDYEDDENDETKEKEGMQSALFYVERDSNPPSPSPSPSSRSLASQQRPQSAPSTRLPKGKVKRIKREGGETNSESRPSSSSHTPTPSELFSFPPESVDMQDFWTAVYGKNIETPAERERKLIVQKEEMFIAAAKEKQIKRASIINMTMEKMQALSPAGLSDFLDRIPGLQHYTSLLFERGVTGEDICMCDEFDLNHMGISYRPHRLRILKLLDRLRGNDDSFKFRRTLTKTLIDPTLTLHHRALPVNDGYKLIISAAKPSAAQLAAMALAEAEKLMKERLAREDAAANAKTMEKARKRLEKISEFCASSHDILLSFQSRQSEEAEVLLKEEAKKLITKEAREAEIANADTRYFLRQQVRSQYNLVEDQVDILKFKARRERQRNATVVSPTHIMKREMDNL